MDAHRSAGASRGFTRTLVAGALCALALPAAVLAVSPLTGARAALALAWTLSAGACLLAASDGGQRDAQRRRVGGASAILAVGVLVLLQAPSVQHIAIAMTFFVAVARSGVLFHARPARAIVSEVAIGACALAVVTFLHSPGLLGNALALWGWFVVQSFIYLLGGLELRRSQRSRGDPFDDARERLLELLDPH